MSSLNNIGRNKTFLFELGVIIILLISYIAIRSVHFSSHLNFSSEQASFSLKTMELYKNHKIELIGPPISFRIGARYLFQGSLVYYVMMPLLILGNWDPVTSSYLMVILGALILIPLYCGVRLLCGKKEAIIISTLFVFLPFYIDYSRFFWNPNFQFLFTPFVILFMGLHKKYHKVQYLFLVSFSAGFLLLFHYQYILIILSLLIYYLFFEKIDSIKQTIIFLIGFPIGFSPMILFELRNQFYNTQTLFLFIQNFKNTIGPRTSQSIGAPHYMLSISLFVFTFFIHKIIRKIHSMFFIILLIFIGVFSTFNYSQIPTHGFGMTYNWNYALELKTNSIIKSQKKNNYNIVNLGYDTIAVVQKYFLIKDGVQMNFDDYYRNDFLFIITKNSDYMKNPAYEVNTFMPNIIVNSWRLNDTYNMFLLERIK